LSYKSLTALLISPHHRNPLLRAGGCTEAHGCFELGLNDTKNARQSAWLVERTACFIPAEKACVAGGGDSYRKPAGPWVKIPVENRRMFCHDTFRGVAPVSTVENCPQSRAAEDL
jgi:hypothetical protein